MRQPEPFETLTAQLYLTFHRQGPSDTEYHSSNKHALGVCRLKAHITVRSPAFFEDSFDIAEAVPNVNTDPLALKKCVPASWEQDVYEGMATTWASNTRPCSNSTFHWDSEAEMTEDHK